MCEREMSSGVGADPPHRLTRGLVVNPGASKNRGFPRTPSVHVVALGLLGFIVPRYAD